MLVLGSLPGDASIAAARYYAHPGNGFWRLMGAVIRADLAGLGYEDRLAALTRAGVALWDVIGAARRVGSLDGAIVDALVNDLAAFAATLPALRAVGLNGGLATRHGSKALAGMGLALVPLPSSSAANTASFEAKREVWLRLRAWLA